MGDETRAKKRHTIPGEHKYDGQTFGRAFDPNVIERIKNFQFDDSDVILVTYLKCGSTWMQSIADRVCHKNNKDIVNSDLLDERVPYLDYTIPDTDVPGKCYMDIFEAQIPPRLIKTHLQDKYFHKSIENKKTKFVVTMRNPKDALVSYYHFYAACYTFGPYKGTWNEWFDDLVVGDHLLYGNWFDHVLSWWKYKDYPNVIYFKFEDMVKDPHKEVKRLADFLSVDLSPEIIDEIVMDTSFAKMKVNSLVNKEELKSIGMWDKTKPGFMRKGKVGDWKNYFTEEQSAYIDGKVKETLEGTGLTFDFEI